MGKWASARACAYACARVRISVVCACACLLVCVRVCVSVCLRLCVCVCVSVCVCVCVCPAVRVNNSAFLTLVFGTESEVGASSKHVQMFSDKKTLWQPQPNLWASACWIILIGASSSNPCEMEKAGSSSGAWVFGQIRLGPSSQASNAEYTRPG